MHNQDLYQYTLMPAHMIKLFTFEELKSASRAALRLDQGCAAAEDRPQVEGRYEDALLSLPREDEDTNTGLYDLEADPGQTRPLDDAAVKKRLKEALFRMMTANDASEEAMKRMQESLES